MEYGAHLPLIDFGTSPSLRGLKEYARAAADLDYRCLCANDHLLFGRPWLDGPTALAAVIEESRRSCARDHHRAARHPRPGAAREDARRDRCALGGPLDRRRRPWFVGRRLRRRRRPLRTKRRTALRRSTQRASCPPRGLAARASRASSTPRRNRPRSRGRLQQPRPPIWVASWGSPGSPTGRAPRRRLDRLCLQHDAGSVPRRASTASPRAPTRRPDSGVSQTQSRRPGSTSPKTRNEAERVLTDVLAPMLKRPVEALRALLAADRPGRALR